MRRSLEKMSLQPLSYIFFNCIAEEIDCGAGAYHIPDFGQLVYCGLQGAIIENFFDVLFFIVCL